MVKKKFSSRSMKTLLCMFVVAITTNVSAQELSDVTLIVTGQGVTQEKATTSALRSALEQTYGALVSSNTQILNDSLLRDEIVSITTGFVKKYDYQSVTQVDNLFYVVLEAVVSPQNLISYVKQKGVDVSSFEVDGASFAANVKMRKLNEINRRKACQNLFEMQTEILPQCFEYTTKVHEPRDVRAYYEVDIDIDVKWNQNIYRIVELENQILQLSELREHGLIDLNFDYGLHGYFCGLICNIIFHDLKIRDNFSEYSYESYLVSENENGWKYSRIGSCYFDYRGDFDARGNYRGKQQRFTLHYVPKNSRGDNRLHFISESDLSSTLFKSGIDGTFDFEYLEKELWRSRKISKVYTPDLENFLKLRFSLRYTLEELENLTKIEVVTKKDNNDGNK